MLSIDSDGRSGSGMKLADLDDEAPLPELTIGPDKYRILGELGVGGMGKVFLAYDQDGHRRVALKMITVAEPSCVRRFLEEAQVLGQLQHPNIVPMHELGVSDGKPYYAMPVVRGRTLSDVIEKLREGDKATQGFSLARRMQLFVQSGQAVSYAHAKGVIHRDLKPGNVMVGGHGEVQLMDWGLANVVEAGDIDTGRDGRLTRTGHIIGTPQYMAPEQANGEEATAAADIYSLGVMLYELLTLELPFGGSPMQILTSHMRELPRPPRQRAHGRTGRAVRVGRGDDRRCADLGRGRGRQGEAARAGRGDGGKGAGQVGRVSAIEGRGSAARVRVKRGRGAVRELVSRGAEGRLDRGRGRGRERARQPGSGFEPIGQAARPSGSRTPSYAAWREDESASSIRLLAGFDRATPKVVQLAALSCRAAARSRQSCWPRGTQPQDWPPSHDFDCGRLDPLSPRDPRVDSGRPTYTQSFD